MTSSSQHTLQLRWQPHAAGAAVTIVVLMIMPSSSHQQQRMCPASRHIPTPLPRHTSSLLLLPWCRCKDCKTNNCFRNCKARCPQPVPRPPQVNGDRCRRNGRDFGRRVNRAACDTTRLYCNGGVRPQTAMATRTGGIGAVSLQQVGGCRGFMFRDKEPLVAGSLDSVE
jgi:hypothetical protein